jgi:hypothetical protein
LSKILAVAGTVLVCFPVAFMIITSVAGSIAEGRFLLDYLMPAEFFLVVMAGGLLLLWAAIRAHQHLKAVIVGLAAAAFFLVTCQLAATVSGIASGAAPPEGPVFVVIIAALAAYSLAVVWLDVTGILLSRKLIKSRPEN